MREPKQTRLSEDFRQPPEYNKQTDCNERNQAYTPIKRFQTTTRVQQTLIARRENKQIGLSDDFKQPPEYNKTN